MNKAMAALLLAACAGAAIGQDISPGATRPATAPASPPGAAGRLAAESLRNSAFSMVHSPAGTPARARRLVALVSFADRLEPGHPQTQWMLSNIHESQGKVALAAEALARCRLARGDDHALAVRWLALSVEKFGADLSARVRFLRSVIARKDLPAAVLAEAAWLLARLYEAQGSNEALKTYEWALSLDPGHAGALAGRLALLKAAGKDTPLERIRTMLAMAAGSPESISAAWQAAALLDRLGLYEQSLELFEHSAASAGTGGAAALSDAFIVNHINALLDAGKAKQAVDAYGAMQKRFADSVDFRTLMLEAYRGLGETTRATAIIKVMELNYKAKEGAAAVSASLATELAWFYLVTMPRPESALVHARQAAMLSPNNPIVQRILGAAELLAKRKDLVAAGEKRLRKLHEQDLHAAAFLAEHYFAARDEVSGKAAVLAGAKIARSGPAFRRLLAVAKAHDVPIPAADGSIEARKLFAAFDRRYLDMAASPQKFLAVEIHPVGQTVAPGEPVEIDVVLRNRGEVDLPLGAAGLCSPVVALKVTASGAAGAFADLPLATCPAPRYLKPGGESRCRVRLDVGRLVAYLGRRPLEDVTLTVTGLLDPVQRGSRVDSALPGVSLRAAKITRVGLLGRFDRTVPDQWRRTYQRRLGLIVGDMKRGTVRLRVRAARQVGSLLAMAGPADMRKPDVPKHLASVFGRGVLLSMFRAVLRDESDVVRAEMIAALGGVALDEIILQLLAPAIDDPSALVRFRLVELLGASGLPGQEPVLDHLSRDRHDLVRMMASAFPKRPAGRRR